MKSLNIPFSTVPDFFRNEFFKNIFSYSEKHESLQMVGISGFGKSLTLRSLETNQETIKVKINADIKQYFYLCDLDLLSDGSTYSVLKYIFGRLIGIGNFGQMDNTDLAYRITEYFSSLKAKGHRLTIILDSFDRLAYFHNQEIYEFLYGLYKNNLGYVNFIFSVDHEIKAGEARSNFGELGRLIIGNILYFSNFDSDESAWFLDSLSRIYGREISQKERKIILTESGGYPVIIKRLYEASNAGFSLSELVIHPENYPSLLFNLDSIKGSVAPYTKTLNQIILDSGKTVPADDLAVLQNYCILDGENKFISKVFENYLKHVSVSNEKTYAERMGDLEIPVPLTSSEYKILNFLYRKGNVCGREEIIEEVWGSKAVKGVSDHALDQIIMRLRKKLKESGGKIGIETLWGRGHRLVK